MPHEPAAVAREESFRSLLGGSTLVFTARVVGAVTTFGTQVLLARWLGAAELGVYVYAFSWCLLLGTVSQLGLGTAAIRFIADAQARGDDARLKGFLRRSTAVVAAGSAAFCLCGIGAAAAYGSHLPGNDAVPFIVASLIVPLIAILHFLGSTANGFGWVGLAFVPSNVVRPVLAAAAIVIVWYLAYPMDALGALLIQAAAMLVCAAALGLSILGRIARRLAGVRPSYRTKLWVRTALPLLVITLFVHYIPEFNFLLLGFYLPSNEIAIFNASYRVALLIAFGLSAVDASFMPAAARLFAAAEKSALQSAAAKAAQLRFWGALSAVLLFAAFGSQVLGIFGEEFRTGYRALILLALAQLVHAAVGPVTALLSVTGHQKRCLPVFSCAMIGNLLLVTVLVPIFGIDGAAASVLLVTLGWSVWLHGTVRTHLDIRPSALSALVPGRTQRRTGAH